MKKIRVLLILVCAVMVVGLLCGCAKEEHNSNVTPDEYKIVRKVEDDNKKENDSKMDILTDVFPLEMSFSSGAGGWGTYITIKEDGSFVGNYHDSEMGITGEDYDATIYICEFSGKFEFTEQIDDYSYSLKLVEINTEHEPDTEWIEDRVKYISSTPYGLEEGKDFILYTPETPVSVLSEELLSWWPHRFTAEDERTETLSCYGLHNVEKAYGFFSAE